MPPTIPPIMTNDTYMPRRHYSSLQFFEVSLVPARSVPVQFHFKITKNRTTHDGEMGAAVFPDRCEPPTISSFWERLDNYLV